MSLNNTPSSERTHIAFFGKRNAGKSSTVNAVTNQSLSIVSDTKGTTTDPVFKAMELLPAGPVMIIDTPGFDDEGKLGNLRIEKTMQILAKTDIAVLIIDASIGISEEDKRLTDIFKEKNIDYIIAFNKSDLLETIPTANENEIFISSAKKTNIDKLKEMIASLCSKNSHNKTIISHLLKEDDVVILVTPIDESAPKGRLILPQQQTIRDIIDKHAVSVVVQPSQLKTTLSLLKQKPKLVITDSQVFAEVAKDTPDDIKLTSFSILFANYKGVLEQSVRGVKALDSLRDGDRILISEGCTHHRQCGDIGTVKLPKLIEKYTGVKPTYEFSSGTDYPGNRYKMIIHCGGCMLSDREMKNRLSIASTEDIPFTNYGIAISYMNGILKRTIEIFPDLYSLLDK
ncbi:MAG: [Oscillospiraceae bacterium]|nr:[FeFe] hydrogenase H-cluster maturation GTPase HydF [Oscillospiraceae bacterium]MBQ9982450.1 [FeFe] hydrogenase H-cluster maturation GTPase HydF [Oscillospiraceae bacterium]